MKHYRGLGGTYKRGKIWWVHYSVRSVVHRESSKSRDEKDAIKLLKTRIGDAANGKSLSNKRESVTLRDLLDALRSDYEVNHCSLVTLDRAEPYLTGYFKEKTRALDLTLLKLKDYVAHRAAQPVKRNKKTPSNSTINQELRLLRRAFHLLVEGKTLSSDDVPKMPMLPEAPARQGFVDPAEFAALLEEMPEHLRDPISFLYLSGWRKGEMKTLEWRDVDFDAQRIVLRAERSKNGEQRTLKLFGELLAIIERAKERRSLSIPFVFHHNRRPIGDFRNALANACDAVGLGKVMPHDFRRSAVRNMIRSGVNQAVAMRMSGHKDPSVFARYNVIDERDLNDGAAMMDAYVKEQAQRAAKVVPLRRAS